MLAKSTITSGCILVLFGTPKIKEGKPVGGTSSKLTGSTRLPIATPALSDTRDFELNRTAKAHSISHAYDTFYVTRFLRLTL